MSLPFTHLEKVQILLENVQAVSIDDDWFVLGPQRLYNLGSPCQQLRLSC